jgi:hypothetical protein
MIAHKTCFFFAEIKFIQWSPFVLFALPANGIDLFKIFLNQDDKLKDNH